MKLNNVTERDIEVKILEKRITWKSGFIHFVRFWKLVVGVLVVFFSVFWRFRLGWRNFRTFGSGKLSAFLNVRRTLKVNVEIKLPCGMLKITHENKRSASCTRESGTTKENYWKTTNSVFFSISLIPPLIFATSRAIREMLIIRHPTCQNEQIRRRKYFYPVSLH